MSILSKIANTTTEAAWDRFKDSNDRMNGAVEHSFAVKEALDRAVPTEAYYDDQVKLADYVEEAAGTDVVQLVPNGTGYVVNTSSSPRNVKVASYTISYQEALELFTHDIIKEADARGFATIVSHPAHPTILEDVVGEVTGHGVYSTVDSTGRAMTGVIVPGMFDPVAGKITDRSIFIGNGVYGTSTTMSGKLLGSNVAKYMKGSSELSGIGVFASKNLEELMVTIPFILKNSVNDMGTRTMLVEDFDGNTLTMRIEKGLKRPITVGPGVIAMPSHFRFIKLGKRVPMVRSPSIDMRKMASEVSAGSSCEIRHLSDSSVALSGPIFKHAGAGTHSIGDAVMTLGLAGMTQGDSISLIRKSASDGSVVTVHNLYTLLPQEDCLSADRAARAEIQKFASAHCPDPIDLLREITAITMDKEATSLLGKSTVDSVLSLNFINPRNLQMYSKYAPELDRAAEKLATLVLAAQLGVSQIPIEAAVNAMEGVEKVVSAVRAFESIR